MNGEDRPARMAGTIDARAQTVLDRLQAQDAQERTDGVPRKYRLRQITPEVGCLLHILVLSAKPARILEIGTSAGYSTIWLASAARAVGGLVTTLENDPRKVDMATQNIRDAGLDDVTTVVPINAFDYVGHQRDPLDFVFLDAEKDEYLSLSELLLPFVPIGGMFVADNLLSHAADLVAFRSRMESDPHLSTVVVPIGRGELLAVRTS